MSCQVSCDKWLLRGTACVFGGCVARNQFCSCDACHEHQQPSPQKAVHQVLKSLENKLSDGARDQCKPLDRWGCQPVQQDDQCVATQYQRMQSVCAHVWSKGSWRLLYSQVVLQIL